MSDRHNLRRGIQPLVSPLLSAAECSRLIGVTKRLKPIVKELAEYTASVDFEIPCPDELYERVEHFMKCQNGDFGFSLDALETPLIIAASGPGAESPWHQDYQFYGSDDCTKLSASILLQPADAGGVLEFMDTPIIQPQIGDAAVFPAFLTHRVTPVIAGTRIVLVAFMSGSQFR